MEHLLFRQIACMLFLLFLGAARYYFVSTSARRADPSSPASNWARHVPAYFASAVWAVYAAGLALLLEPPFKWDRWPVTQANSELLGWIAVPLLVAGGWLFWYSHHTIGRYWSIRIQLKRSHRLVTHGPYAYVRHPLYTALFLGYLGTLLALQSWALAAWFPVFVASYLIFALEEEKVMERGFGDTYRAYRLRAGMFIPRWSSVRADVSRAAARWRARVRHAVAQDDE